MCAKPCTGDWQYVGGSFKQIDGGNNIVIGVTTNNTLIAISLQGRGKNYVHVYDYNIPNSHWCKNQGGWGGGASAPLVKNIGELSPPYESIIVHVYISEVCGTLGSLGISHS